MEEEQEITPFERKRALLELKRQVVRKVDSIQDEILLQSILELINDAEVDYMDAEKDPELVAASEIDLEHPDNKRRPAPVNQPNKNNSSDWLDGLGR
jgi:hypothetical protein